MSTKTIANNQLQLGEDKRKRYLELKWSFNDSILRKYMVEYISRFYHHICDYLVRPQNLKLTVFQAFPTEPFQLVISTASCPCV